MANGILPSGELIRQIEATRKDLPTRVASIFLLTLLTVYFIRPGDAQFPWLVLALGSYLGLEAVGEWLSTVMLRRPQGWHVAAIHILPILGSTAFVAVPVLLFTSGNVAAATMGATALAASLLHCIVGRTVALGIGLATAAPMAAGLLFMVGSVLLRAPHPLDAAVAVVMLAILVFYVGRTFAEAQALNDSLAGARSASRAKSRFIAAMSHEIRTPLNAICAMADFLADEPDEAAAHERIALLRSSAHHLSAIVEDVLDHAAIESGRLTLRPTAASLEEAVATVAGIFGEQAKEKGLELTASFHTDVPALALFDTQRLRQSLSNLVSNAIKYTDRGSVTLHVSCTEVDTGWEAIIAVSDTGRGIGEADVSRLFEDFSRIPSEENVSTPGTGLGLAITRSFARLMGGDVTVSSRLGRGSTFTLRVRLGRPQAATAAPMQDGGLPAPDAGAIDRLKRLLVVDDVASNRYIIRAFFQPMGIVVDEAVHGREALQLLQTQDYDLMLVDIQMPVMDGPALLEALDRAGGRAARTPVIILTANVDREQLPERVRIAAGFATKPVRKSDLIAEIERVLGQAEPEGRTGPVAAE